MTTPHTRSEGSLVSYTIGVAASLLCTIFSFLLAPSLGAWAAPSLVLSALLQLFAQLYFFLHIGRGRMTGSYVVLLSFSALVVGIIVGGTLWIMSNLSHMHMHPVTAPDLYEHGIVAPQNELR